MAGIAPFGTGAQVADVHHGDVRGDVLLLVEDGLAQLLALLLQRRLLLHVRQVLCDLRGSGL